MKKSPLFITAFSFLALILLLSTACVTTPKNETDKEGQPKDIKGARYTLHYNTGLSRLGAGKPTYAMVEFIEAEKYKKTPELYYAMGQTCYELKRYALSLDYFDKTLFMDKDFSKAYVGKGIVLIAMERYDEAIVQLKKSLENIIFHEPESAYYNIAVAYAKMNNYEGAVENLKTAIRLKPEYIPPYLELARIYRKMGRFDLSESVLQEALEQYPELAQAHYMLGIIYLEQKRSLAAKMEFSEVIKLVPDTPLAREAEKYLKGLEN
ncbi:MAG: tetratricopeptide repeat protein [Deltaproteobacteria bacterium]|uniref:Tetratricopeptide repeat protein n=1 Tax=Candidatus Zymogenus saltonus TaxID=2844893 RepID=A0A9D8KG90_9DELT|nr:tetratricopeptide repeat protein [Candidatus Zymogenus saltonus]